MAYNFREGTSSIKDIIVAVALIVMSIILITVYAREGESGIIHNLQSGTSTVVAPLKFVSGVVSHTEDMASDTAENATASADTLSALREQNEQLRQTVAQLEEYRQEAQRLQQLLGLSDTYKISGTAARVLSRSTDAWNNVVTIDKGSNEGIRAGLAVVGSSGLVGQVIAVTNYTSDVRLMNDPAFGVAAMIQSNRAEGILKGSLDGLLYLEDVSSDAAVTQGDVVVTSGLGGGFSRGLLLGTVVKVEGQQGDSDRRIIVEPNATVGPLEEVMVVTSTVESASNTADAKQQATQDEQTAQNGSSASGNRSSSSSSASQTSR